MVNEKIHCLWGDVYLLFSGGGSLRNTGGNPVEVTTLIKPRSQERGSLFYGKAKRSLKLWSKAKNQGDSPWFYICNIALTQEHRR